MNLVSAFFVAYSIFDFLPKTVDVPPELQTKFFDSGAGELLLHVENSESIGSIPRGASRVFLGEVNFSASCDAAVTVSSVTVKHTGLGSSSDIRGVYFLDGYRRVSRVARFDSQSSEAVVPLTSLTIPRCEARTLGLYADFLQNAAVGSEHGVTIESPSDVVSSAKSVTVSIGDSTKQIFTTPYRTGTITVNFLPVYGSLRYGSIATVARLQLTADRDGSHLLQKITLTNDDTAHDMDLIYFSLETTSGKKLSAPATRMYGDKVFLTFDPTYLLSAGETVVLLLKAEVRGSARRGVRFLIDDPSDVVSIPTRVR